MAYSLAALIIIVLFSIFCMLINIISFGVHFYLPQLRSHPSSMLIIYLFSQIILLTHWIFFYPTLFWYYLLRNLPTETCQIIGSYSIFFYYSSWLSMVFLSTEIYIVLRYKSYKLANLRIYIYNFLTIILSTMFLLLFIYTDSVGISILQTCFFKMNSPGMILDSILHLIFIIALITGYIKIRKHLDCFSSKVFKHISKIILLVTMTSIINRIISFIIHFEVHLDSQASIYSLILGGLGSIFSSGIAGLSRIVHPKIRKRFKEKLRNSKKHRISISNNEQLMKSILQYPQEESEDIADIFQNLGKRILIQILAVLTLNFKNDQQPVKSLEKLINNHLGTSITKHFEKSLYDLLILEYNMPFILKFYCPKFLLIEYEPEIFALIRKSINFSNSDMLDSLLSHENIKALIELNNKGGRSDSFFFKSSNQKIIIKTIAAQEKLSFLKLLPSYAKRVISVEKSKLIRILGLFQILPHKQDFIIMENAVKDFSDCLIFDLKGSTVDREVKGLNMKEPPKGVVMKDVNFNEFGVKAKVFELNEVLLVLRDDMKILRKCKIMDYSLLLVANDKGVDGRYAVGQGVSVAVIDFFQRFSAGKVVEGWWKKYALRNSDGVSSVSPVEYYKRIKKYLNDVFVDDERKDRLVN